MRLLRRLQIRFGLKLAFVGLALASVASWYVFDVVRRRDATTRRADLLHNLGVSVHRSLELGRSVPILGIREEPIEAAFIEYGTGSAAPQPEDVPTIFDLLAECEHLTTLAIRGTSVTPIAIRHVPRCLHLTELMIDGPFIDDAETRDALSRLPELHSLEIQSCDSAAVFDAMRLSVNLRALDLRYNEERVNSGFLQRIGQLPKLRVLRLWDVEDGAGLAAALHQLSDLTELSVWIDGGDAPVWKSIGSLSKLSQLDLHVSWGFRDDQIAVPQAAKYLRGLSSLAGLTTDGLPLEAIAHLPDDAPLRYLKMKVESTNQAAAAARLERFSTLEFFEFAFLRDGQAAPPVISQLANVVNLRLIGISVSARDISAIAKLPHLRLLSIRSAEMDSEAIQACRQLKQLERLTVPRGASAVIAKQLPNTYVDE